jgi:Tol biopolymer transport system component
VRAPRGAQLCDPSWAPDGKQLVFALRLSDETTVLYRANRSGKPLGRVGRRYRATLIPAWSPDGRSLIFVRGRGELYRIDLRVKMLPRRLMRLDPEVRVSDPAWQPLSR